MPPRTFRTRRAAHDARHYLELFENPTAEERALIVMWGATFPSQASIDGMLEADQRSYDGWADLIRRGQEDGSIRSDLDPTAAAVVLFGLMRGVAALLLTESEIEGHGQRPGDVRRLDRRRAGAPGPVESAAQHANGGARP